MLTTAWGNWTLEGHAFRNQPTYGDNVLTARVAPVALGGDYWNVPYEIGNKGNFWIGTYENRHQADAALGGTQGDGPTGRLISPEFTITTPFIHFLIAGGNDPEREKVVLEVKGGSAGTWLPMRSATGKNSEVLRRETWDVTALANSKARIVIVDNSSGHWGHINVDDIQFGSTKPSRGTDGRDQNAPLWGLADPHAHLMSHMGFGRKVFFGWPFDPDPNPSKRSEERMASALPRCTLSHGFGGISLNPEIGHLEAGYPYFNGWPRFTSTVHQQAYVDWIKRSYDGGLRLVTMLATNAELMAARYVSQIELAGGKDNRETLDHDDALAIDDQIRAMREMVEFVDNQNGGRGRGWMEIATSPQEARRIIGENKLAVILGIEVDSLGNWRKPEDLIRLSGNNLVRAREIVRIELQRLHDAGVRQITPIHLTDNYFGGAAVYHRMFDALNLYVTGHHYNTEQDSRNSVAYRLLDDTAGNLAGLTVAYGPENIGKWEDPSWSIPGGNINKRGMTDYGGIILEEMMNLHMIIDVDHMGQKTLDEALPKMVARNYPVISSHSGFRDLALSRSRTSDPHKLATETLKRPDQVETIRRLGGIVAPITLHNDVRDVGEVFPALRDKVSNDSPGSSKTWAQVYLYALSKMGGRNVAIASDVNGMAGLPGPRFGPMAAYAVREENDHIRNQLRRRFINLQTNAVKYMTPMSDFRWYRFEEVGPGGYDMEERDIWEAIAIIKAGLNPWQPDYLGPPGVDAPPIPQRTGIQQNKINNIAKGLFAGLQQMNGSRRIELERPIMFGGFTYDEQRSGYLVATGEIPTNDRVVDPLRVAELYPRIKAIWEIWARISNSPSKAPPLLRSVAGRRDYDINIDGFAHYGMIPDFLQDTKNVGLTTEDLTPLFRSAEDYIRMWEKCQR